MELIEFMSFDVIPISCILTLHGASDTTNSTQSSCKAFQRLTSGKLLKTFADTK